MLPVISIADFVLLDVLGKSIPIENSLNELESFLDILIKLVECNQVNIDAILLLDAFKILYLFVQTIDNILVMFHSITRMRTETFLNLKFKDFIIFLL